MKRNTILISVLGVAGLVAVWWFMLRRASAADPLADTLTGTETSGTGTLGSSQLAGASGTDLLSTLTGLVTTLTGKPASGTTSTTPASSTSNLSSTGAVLTPSNRLKPIQIIPVNVTAARRNRDKLNFSTIQQTRVSKAVPRSSITKATTNHPAIKKL